MSHPNLSTPNYVLAKCKLQKRKQTEGKTPNHGKLEV
jgi:hypothetical protein